MLIDARTQMILMTRSSQLLKLSLSGPKSLAMKWGGAGIARAARAGELAR